MRYILFLFLFLFLVGCEDSGLNTGNPDNNLNTDDTTGGEVVPGFVNNMPVTNHNHDYFIMTIDTVCIKMACSDSVLPNGNVASCLHMCLDTIFLPQMNIGPLIMVIDTIIIHSGCSEPNSDGESICTHMFHTVYDTTYISEDDE